MFISDFLVGISMYPRKKKKRAGRWEISDLPWMAGGEVKRLSSVDSRCSISLCWILYPLTKYFFRHVLGGEKPSSDGQRKQLLWRDLAG